MALDASIYGNLLGRPVRSVSDWDAHYQAQDDAKQARAFNALALQLRQGQMQQAQREQQDEDVIRNALMQIPQGADDTARVQALRATGLPKAYTQADALSASMFQRQKAEREAADAEQKRGLEMAKHRQSVKEYVIQALQTARTPEQAQWFISNGVQQGAWGMQEAQQMLQSMQGDQRGYEVWRQDQLRQILAADKQIPKTETRDAGGTVQTLKIDPVHGTVGVANTVNKTLTPGEVATDARARAQMAQSERHFNINRQDRMADRAAGGSAQGGALTEKPATESERTAGFLLQRLRDSQRQLAQATKDNPEAAKPGVAQEAARLVSEPLANTFTNQDRQRVEAAQLDILDAALTLGTGAAYTREQLNGYRKSYFPQLGDKPAVVNEKADRLQNLIRAAEVKAGRSSADVNQPKAINWGDLK